MNVPVRPGMNTIPGLYPGTAAQPQHGQQPPPMANLASPGPPPMGGLLANNMPGGAIPGGPSMYSQSLTPQQQAAIQHQQRLRQHMGAFGPQPGGPVGTSPSMGSLQPNAQMPNVGFPGGGGPQAFNNLRRVTQPGAPGGLQAQQNSMMGGSSNLSGMPSNMLAGMNVSSGNLSAGLRPGVPSTAQQQQFMRLPQGVSPSPANQQQSMLQGASGQPGQSQPSGQPQLGHMQSMPLGMHREFGLQSQQLQQGQPSQQHQAQMQQQHQRTGSLGLGLPGGIGAPGGGMSLQRSASAQAQAQVMGNSSHPPALTQAHALAPQAQQQQQQMHPGGAMNPSLHPHQQQQQSHQASNQSSASPFQTALGMPHGSPHQLGQQSQSQGLPSGVPMGMQPQTNPQHSLGGIGVGIGGGMGGVVGGGNGGPSPPQRPGSHNQHGLPHSQPQTPSVMPMSTTPGAMQPGRPQSRSAMGGAIGGNMGMGMQGDKGMMGFNGAGGGAGMGVGSSSGGGGLHYGAVMGSLQNHAAMNSMNVNPMGRMSGQQTGVGGSQNSPAGGSAVPGSSNSNSSYSFAPSNMGGGGVGMQGGRTTPGHTQGLPMASLAGSPGGPSGVGPRPGIAPMGGLGLGMGSQGAGLSHGQTPSGAFLTPAQLAGGMGQFGPHGTAGVGGNDAQRPPSRQQQIRQSLTHPPGGGPPGLGAQGPHPQGSPFQASGRQTPGAQMSGGPQSQMSPGRPASAMRQQQSQQQHGQMGMTPHVGTPHLVHSQVLHPMGQDQHGQPLNAQTLHMQQQQLRQQQQQAQAQHPQSHIMSHLPPQAGRSSPAVTSQHAPGSGPMGQPMHSQQHGQSQGQSGQAAGVSRTPRSQQAQLPQGASTQPSMAMLGTPLNSLVNSGLRQGMGPPQLAHQQQAQNAPSPRQRPPSVAQHHPQQPAQPSVHQQQSTPPQRRSQTPRPQTPRQGQPSTSQQPNQPIQSGTQSIAQIAIQSGAPQHARPSIATTSLPPFVPGQVGAMPPTPGAVVATPAAQMMPHFQIPPSAALQRLLQFSGVLAVEKKERLCLEYWKGIVHEYFTERASVKITLWKDNQRNEAKPFDIGVPILPRFFLVTSQSGVKSMSFTLDNAVETPRSNGAYVIECVSAVWTYRYDNGYTVALRGPLTATAQMVPAPGGRYTMKFDSVSFDAHLHEKSLAIDAILGSRSDPTPRIRHANIPNATPNTANADDQRSPEELRINIDKANIPAEPVNAFGIPQATMRCLEVPSMFTTGGAEYVSSDDLAFLNVQLAESVGQMDELIKWSTQTGTGPIDALKMLANKYRSEQQPMLDGQLMNGMLPNPAAGGLYGAQSSPRPLNSTTPATGRPGAQQRPGDTSSPLLGSTPSASGQTPTNGPLAAGPSGSTSSTPQLANATLKRKNPAGGDLSSPTTASGEQQQPPTKRQARKHRKTNAGS